MHSFELHSNESACRKKVHIGLEQVLSSTNGRKERDQDFSSNHEVLQGNRSSPTPYMRPGQITGKRRFKTLLK